MKRDLKRLSGETFDILVIGGGIHGAAVAYEAARCGLAVALIEKKDFAWATSANSLKIIHGGIRYLQQADLFRLRESVRARREMMAFAGDFIQPLPCIIPTYGFGIKSKEMMRLALGLYDILSRDRNKGLPKTKAIPPGRILSKKECLALFPEARPNGLSGAALWYDALAADTERIPLTYILKAVGMGSVAANYFEAVDLIRRQNQVAGVKGVDILTGQELELKAGTVINASGPWMNEVVQSKKFKPLGWVKGMNLVIRKKLVSKCAVGLEMPQKTKSKNTGNDDNRMLFLVPWKGHTLIGTLYKAFNEKPDTLKVEESEAREFLDIVNIAFPAAKLDLDDVSFFHCGLLPSHKIRDSHPSAIPDGHSEIIDHEKTDGLKGIISIKSVKYTTAPQLAKRVMRHLKAKGVIKKGPGQKKDSGKAIPAPSDVFTTGKEGVDPEVVFHAVNEEMACRLSDLVFRRTNLGTAGPPQKRVLVAAARAMGELLGWTPQRIKEEIQEVDSCYAFRNS